MLKKGLMFSIYLFVAVSAFGQAFPGISKQGQAEAVTEDERSRKLAEFQKRILKIQREAAAIQKDYQMGNLTKEKAQEALRPLLREQNAISSDPDFLVEMQLHTLLSQGFPGMSKGK